MTPLHIVCDGNLDCPVGDDETTVYTNLTLWGDVCTNVHIHKVVFTKISFVLNIIMPYYAVFYVISTYLISDVDHMTEQ